jgi:hypothetical protein
MATYTYWNESITSYFIHWKFLKIKSSKLGTQKTYFSITKKFGLRYNVENNNKLSLDWVTIDMIGKV